MLIIIITVFILEIVLLTGIRTYYFKSLEDILNNEIELSLDYYSRYYSSKSLNDIIIDGSDVFWQNTNFQVQIFDRHGKLLMDSIGSNADSDKTFFDVQNAIKGNKTKWTGTVEYYDHPVMSISSPKGIYYNDSNGNICNNYIWGS